MYSTCLFCRATLGRNDAVERFPVGRRLAFDLAKGRLWVVCLRCARWNLTPLEERWEAIEECERLFRDARARVSTGQIGLAHLGDGTKLVRIGAPLLPELAAWRYGTRLHARRWHAAVRNVAGHAGGMAAASLILLSGGLLIPPVWVALRLRSRAARERILARATAESGETITIHAKHLRRTELVARSRELGALEVAHDGGEARVVGAAALRLVRALLPALNADGASEPQVVEAARRVEGAGGATPFLHGIANRRARREEIVYHVPGGAPPKPNVSPPLGCPASAARPPSRRWPSSPPRTKPPACSAPRWTASCSPATRSASASRGRS